MITLDATSQSTGTGTSLTFSHINAGNLLVVGVTAGASDVISGVTFNGVAMTRINISNNGNSTAYLYYLLAPSIGTFNIVISATSSLFIVGDAASFSGVLQSGQPTASVTNTASAVSSVANTLTPPNDNSIHLATYAVDSNALTSITNGTLISSTLGYSNPLLITPAASHTMTGNSSGGNNAWATVGASFSPITATTSTSTSTSTTSTSTSTTSTSTSRTTSTSTSRTTSTSTTSTSTSITTTSTSITSTTTTWPYAFSVDRKV